MADTDLVQSDKLITEQQLSNWRLWNLIRHMKKPYKSVFVFWYQQLKILRQAYED